MEKPAQPAPSGEGSKVRLVTRQGAVTLSIFTLTIIAIGAWKFPGAPWNNNSASALGERLIVAASKGNENVVNNLLHSGAPADWRGKDGVSPLIVSASRGDATIVKALLRMFASVDARTSDGFTPLHAAAAARGDYPGQPELVYSLLAAGADRDALTLDGRTPLVLADGGNPAVLELLKRSPAIKGDGAYTIIDREGDYRTFRAINVASLVGMRDRAAFRTVVHAAQAVELDGNETLADYCTFLPVEAYHITSVHLYAANTTEGNWTQFVSDHLGFFQKLSGILEGGKYEPKVFVDGNATLASKSAITGVPGSELRLLVKDVAELQAWVDALPQNAALDVRDREEVIAGAARAAPFHVTLGYFYKDATKYVDKIRKGVVDAVVGAHERTKFEVIMQKPRLLVSNDMTQYIPWSGATNPWLTRPRVTRIGPPKEDAHDSSGGFDYYSESEYNSESSSTSSEEEKELEAEMEAEAEFEAEEDAAEAAHEDYELSKKPAGAEAGPLKTDSGAAPSNVTRPAKPAAPYEDYAESTSELSSSDYYEEDYYVGFEMMEDYI